MESYKAYLKPLDHHAFRYPERPEIVGVDIGVVNGEDRPCYKVKFRKKKFGFMYDYIPISDMHNYKIERWCA